MYDTISMPSPVSYIFLSPFGHSSLTLKNNLLNPNYILSIKVEFSKGSSFLGVLVLEFSFLYPLLLIASILLFVYAKKYSLKGSFHM